MKVQNKILSLIVFSFVFFAQVLPVLAGPEWNASFGPDGNVGFQIGTQQGLNALNGNNADAAMNNPYGLPGGGILDIISNLLFWLLAIFSVLGIIGFLISGILYLLAGADEDNAKKGKEGMKASIIGIIVGLSGYVIMQAVGIFLRGDTTMF